MRYILLLALLILVACSAPVLECGPQEALHENSCCKDTDEDGVCDKFQFQLQEQEIEPKPGTAIREQIGIELPAEQYLIDELIKNATRRITSFTYRPHNTRFEGSKYYVRGHMVRVDLADPISTNHSKVVDVLLFDRNARTLRGFCVNEEIVCLNQRSAVPLSYEKYWDPTPLDYFAAFKGREESNFVSMSALYDSRRVSALVFPTQDGDVTFTIDNYYYVPLKINSPNTSAYFTDMTFNTVGDETFLSLLQ